MFSDHIYINPKDTDPFRPEVIDPYLKNLAEYQRLLELLSLNKHLTHLLQEDMELNSHHMATK